VPAWQEPRAQYWSLQHWAALVQEPVPQLEAQCLLESQARLQQSLLVRQEAPGCGLQKHTPNSQMPEQQLAESSQELVTRAHGGGGGLTFSVQASAPTTTSDHPTDPARAFMSRL
jgi:hypothetical protein